MGKNKYMQRCRIGPGFQNKGVISRKLEQSSCVLKLGENQHGSHVGAAPEELNKLIRGPESVTDTLQFES